MKRRDFVRSVALTGAAAGIVRTAGPWAAVPSQRDDGDRSPERDALAILRSTLVVDGYSGEPENEQWVKKLRTGEVHCKIGGPESPFPRDIVMAGTVKEIRRIHQQGKIAQVYCTSAFTLGDKHLQPFGDPTPPLAEHKWLRICGLCYNIANAYGGGCLEPQIGLTLAGRRMVEEIHKLRIVLDVGGHLGEQTTLDAIAMSPGVPVINTHGNVRPLNDNPRCNSDRVIEAIAKTGGVLGITTFSDFMVRNPKNCHLPSTPQATMDQYLDQFDYIRKLVGVDHVGLGTDNVCDGDMAHCPPDLEKQNRLVMPIEAYSEAWSYVKGFESMSELPNFVRGLIQRGWTTADIRKVLGENWLRVYEKVWGA